MDPASELSRMPALLRRVLDLCPEEILRSRSGPFALVEHLWHLADLEREGFGARIERMLREVEPALSDFDGERAARERNYLALDPAAGLLAFSRARAENLARLGLLGIEQMQRTGRQEGVGLLRISDFPQRMLDHDRAHANEIADLLVDLAPGHPCIAELRALAEGGPRTSQAA
jgi:hypothetical protein